MTTFVILHSKVLKSAWFDVQSVNTLKKFDIAYPADHDKQCEIADYFLGISAADFGVALEPSIVF
jgi:hypothetical protein